MQETEISVACFVAASTSEARHAPDQDTPRNSSYLERIVVFRHGANKQNAEANNVSGDGHVLKTLVLILHVGINAQEICLVRLGRMVRHVVRPSRRVVAVSMAVVVTSSAEVSRHNRPGRARFT